MKLRILMASMIVISTAAFAAETGPELFQKALTQERAAGNLEEAIKLYQRVATEFASDRALAAKALVQEARCYEKLGQGKAIKLYEQVARDYRDQGESATAANARLAALRAGDKPAMLPATMSQRRIEFTHAPDTALYAFLQTDGQRMVYRDDATGAIMVTDLSGANKRVVFRPKGSITAALATSRDFSMVMMTQIKPDGSRSVAVVKLDGTGYRDTGIKPACRPEFSWDNRYLLLCERPVDNASKALKYSLADGSVHESGTVKSTGVLVFSPDGRFLAYEGYNGGLFVMPVDGGEPHRIGDKGRILDWTRDGHFLAVSADRDGSEALWLLPVKEGRQDGIPIFVRYGSFAQGRVTAGGALTYFSSPPKGVYEEWIASVDADGRAGSWKSLVLSGNRLSNPHLRWSPDGKEFVYATSNRAAGQTGSFARIHNVATGEERQIFQSPGPLYCVWARKEPKLFCGEVSPDKTNLVSVSTETGLTQQLGSAAGGLQLDVITPDDTAIYARPIEPASLLRLDIATKQVATVDQTPGLIAMMSPDARWISRSGNSKIEIRPLAGGEWMPTPAPTGRPMLVFTADGNSLLYRDEDADGKSALYRVSTVLGSQPERIGDLPAACKTCGSLYISPDSRTIIASAANSGAYNSAELSILENFEPKEQTAKK